MPHETLDKEFLFLAEAEGVADIEELNKIIERAVNLKNFLKGKDRIDKVAQFVAEHYPENVEPLGYKAFLVGVDHEACAHYKHALDRFLPTDYSEIVTSPETTIAVKPEIAFVAVMSAYRDDHRQSP